MKKKMNGLERKAEIKEKQGKARKSGKSNQGKQRQYPTRLRYLREIWKLWKKKWNEKKCDCEQGAHSQPEIQIKRRIPNLDHKELRNVPELSKQGKRGIP